MGAVKAKPCYSGATAGAAVLLDLSQRGMVCVGGGWGRDCIRARVVTSQWGFGTNANRREAAGAAQSNALSAARGRAGMSGFLSRCGDSALANTGCYLDGGHFDPELPGRRWLQRGGVSSESLLHNLTPDIISRMNISLANNE